MIVRSAAARVRCMRLLAPLLLGACPNQDLATLHPCTVSGVSEQISQDGSSDVDLLFVIDDSGSMATEQLKLAAELPRLVRVLTTGDRFAGMSDPPDVPDEQRYFTKVRSLHLGVVSSNMGGISAPSAELSACKGLGDDGKLLRSTRVAVEGVVAEFDRQYPDFKKGEVVLPPDPSCASTAPPLYQAYDVEEGSDPEQVAKTFACVSRLGVQGCPFEQQLEAMWKALAPSEGKGAQFTFLEGTSGHGSGANQGFLRPDAVLAVLHVSDEEDCSVKPTGTDLFSLSESARQRFGGREEINVRCSKFGEAQGLLWPASRYIEGLRALKPDHPDRIVFAAIVGIPEDANGTTDLAALLARPEMQFEAIEAGDTLIERPSCRNDRNRRPEQASPPRRFVRVAQGFPDDQVLWSICSDDYSPALSRLIDRIASKLEGRCLPRQLARDEQGLVPCELYEIMQDGATRCEPERGHEGGLVSHSYRDVDGKTVTRRACAMRQVPVVGKQPASGGRGWYYDDFAKSLREECAPGEQQRISFAFADGAVELPPGSTVAYACFQSVTRTEGEQVGLGAVNTPCDESGEEPSCAAKSNGEEEGGYDLVCVERKCQIPCASTPECPTGWVCATGNGGTAEPPRYCQLPTCSTQL